MLFLAAPDARFERASSNGSVRGDIGGELQGVLCVSDSLSAVHRHTCTRAQCACVTDT